MKKVKKILIVVLMFVVTLNINYLGMMNKRIIVESSEYKTGNTDNLVLNKILSDNELKTEIPHMFNYASNGVQYDPNDKYDYETDPNPEYITNGLYSSSDEDGTTYYYRGNIDNNNIVFGAYDEDYYVYGDYDYGYYYQTKEGCIEAENEEYCKALKLASAGDKMLWKIVRVNGDGSLRLIYNGTINTQNSDNLIPHLIGRSMYNSNDYSDYYTRIERTGYIYGNGVDSNVKKEVDTWYNNTLGSNSAYDSKVILGRFCSDSSGYRNNTFRNVFASYDRLIQVENNFAKDNAPTFICPSTSENYGGAYRLKAGLITADEIVYAGESYQVLGKSYLNSGKTDEWYWTMTPVSLEFGDPDVPQIWYVLDVCSGIDISNEEGIRPVINVSTENMTLTGDGTIDNPYILEEVVPTNSYRGKVTIEVGSSVDDIKAFEEELDLSNVTWTVKDSSIAKIENGKIIGLKNGTTVITGVDANGNTYEIEVTVISNPVTNSAIYIGIGIGLILIMSTGLYMFYRKVVMISE